MSPSRRLGVLGGMFDPIHCGHLDTGTAAQRALGLTSVVVVPSNIPPHRPQPVATSHHRFAMVAMAIAGRPGWRADDGHLFILGTDPLGRDMLSRIIYGARASVSVALAGLVIGGGLGSLLGLAAGFGWADHRSCEAAGGPTTKCTDSAGRRPLARVDRELKQLRAQVEALEGRRAALLADLGE